MSTDRFNSDNDVGQPNLSTCMLSNVTVLETQPLKKPMSGCASWDLSDSHKASHYLFPLSRRVLIVDTRPIPYLSISH